MEHDRMEDGSAECPSVSTRKSPRNCVRKVKISYADDFRKIQSEPKQTRKRRMVSFEDDPSYSGGEYEDEIMEQHKKVPGYRCSPHLVPDLMEKLTEKQRGWVKKNYFDSLQHMVDSCCPKSLTMWLVDRVHTGNGRLEVCGIPVDIKQGVERILKLPSGGIKVPQPLNGRSKAKRTKIGTSRTDVKHSDNGRGQSAKDATKALLAENDNEVEFCQSFVMLVLCIYLAPTTSLNINRGYYPALMDISKIGLMDWCGFIAEYLIRGVEEYRRGKESHVQVPGCVHILPLQLLYIDALIENKALVLHEALTLPEGLPRIQYIGTEHLDFLASADVKSKPKDRIEFGLLQDNLRCVRGGVKNFTKQTSSRRSEKSSPYEPVSQHVPSDGEETQKIEANFLDSLFDEIRKNRELVVQDFERKLEQSEQEIFARFREHFLHNFSENKKQQKPTDKSTMCSSAANKDSLQVSISKDSSLQLDACCEGTNHEDQFVCKGNLGANCPSNVVTVERISPTQTNSTESDIAGASIIAPDVSQPEIVVNNQISRSRADRNSGNQVQHPVKEVQKNSEGDKDQTSGHIQTEAEYRLKIKAINSERCFDELQEVVNIALEAAQEASVNEKDHEYDLGGNIPLNLLSETAMKEGAPMYDNSPSVAGNDQYDGIDPANISSASNDFLKGRSIILNKPIFDESPVTPSLITGLKKGKFDALLSIPENEKNSRESGSIIFQQKMLSVSDGEICSLVDKVGEDAETASLNSKSVYMETQQATTTILMTQSEESNSSDSIETDTADDSASDGRDNLLATTPDFILTPSYTFDTQEVIEVPDHPASPPPNDIIHIPPLQKEIESGFRFRFGGTISIATEKMFDRFNHMLEICPTGNNKSVIILFPEC